MDKLTTEQKAQRYNEALERAKGVIEQNPLMEYLKKGIEYILPELKESEDERVRKEVKSLFLGWINGSNPPLLAEECNRWIAWLEKQGEHANFRNKIQIGDKVTRNEDGVLVNLSQLNRVAKKNEKQEEQKPNPCDGCINRKGCINCENGELREVEQKPAEFDDTNAKRMFIKALERVEEQNNKGYKLTDCDKNSWWEDFKICTSCTVKQKPTYKVEPNFKIGDFIVNDYCMGRIVEITNNAYLLDTEQGIPFSCRSTRLWTIQDAKDGDVLCYKDEISLYRHDIKNCTKQETTFGGFVYYCCYDGKRFVVDSLYSLTEQDKMDIHPATKEQRDTLEKAIADAGYRWDKEKLKLEKI